MSSMSFKNKLLLLIGVFTVGFVVSGLFLFGTLNQVKVNGPIYAGIVQQKDLLADILPPPEYLIESYLLVLQMDDANKADLPPLVEKAKVLAKDYEDRHQFWLKDLTDGNIKSLLVTKSYQPGRAFLDLMNKQYIPAIQSGDTKAAQEARRQLATLYEQHRSAIDELVKVATAESVAQEKGALSIVNTKSTIAVIIVVAFLALGAGISVWIMRSVMNQLGGDPAYAAEVVGKIAQGDLSVRVKSSSPGSLLGGMAQMVTYLREVITQIDSATGALASASQSLAVTAGRVAESVASQSESASSMAAAVEEMGASIHVVADNAKNAHGLAAEARDLSVESGSRVQDTIREINLIAGSVEGTARVVHALGEQSDKISGIINVIKEIADQTNLLALNAAIEAARAGEQGRGFAVVADEVRKLAEKTTQSTQEISSMIGEIQQGTQTAVKQMEEGTAQVQVGVKKAAETGESMKAIEHGAGKVLVSVEEISTALQEQSIASNQIGHSVERIAQLTDANSEAVREVSGAAAELESLADRLKAGVGRFRL